MKILQKARLWDLCILYNIVLCSSPDVLNLSFPLELNSCKREDIATDFDD